jgi:hypothetical protein
LSAPPPSEETRLRARVDEYERQLGSQTDLTKRWFELTARNVRATVRQPGRLGARLQGWFNRRIRGS